MIKVLSEPSWGVQIIEDTDSGEVSFQCVCGGIAMYYRRIVLEREEVEVLATGNLDIDKLVSDVCKEVAAVRDRIVPSLAIE
jgi:hypothetical protein